MPELPEVETIRRGLETAMVGRTIEDVRVRVPKLFIGDQEMLFERTVTSIERFGKLLVFRLDSPNVLTVHLKMTGQLIWKPGDGGETVMGGHPEKSYIESLPSKHTHIQLEFTDGSTLYFNDLRKFGLMRVLLASELEELGFVLSLGPDPLEQDFTVGYLKERLMKRPKLAVKTFLLDQSNIAGLGNIYADESLFSAAILPYRLSGELTDSEVRNLHTSIIETLELALQHGGSSSRDYLSATGDKGTYLTIANVYHRTGQGCNRCGLGTIERMKIGGRSSHYCLLCQR